MARLDAHVLSVGLDADALTAAHLTVPYGDHIVVLGSARTGVSTALTTIAAAWAGRYGGGTVRRVTGPADLAAILDELDHGRVGESDAPRPLSRPPHAAPAPLVAPRLVVIDDADRVDDPGGRLAAHIARRRPDLTVAAGARIDVVRTLYGHWIRAVAQSRCGVVLTSTGEVDGDLLGTHLPQRPSIPARPGLGWIIDTAGRQLAQLACADRCGPATSRPLVDGSALDRRFVAEQVARADTEPGRTVVGVVERAAVEAQASAPDAPVEARPHRLEETDPLLEERLPAARDASSSRGGWASGRRAARRAPLRSRRG